MLLSDFATYILCGRHGTWWHGRPCCVAWVALFDIDFHFLWQPCCFFHIDLHFLWQVWRFLTSTFMLRGRRGTFWHRPSCCVAGVALGNIVLTTIYISHRRSFFGSSPRFGTRQASKVLRLSVNLMSVWLALFWWYVSFCVPNGCVPKWRFRLCSKVILLPLPLVLPNDAIWSLMKQSPHAAAKLPKVRLCKSQTPRPLVFAFPLMRPLLMAGVCGLGYFRESFAKVLRRSVRKSKRIWKGVAQ